MCTLRSVVHGLCDVRHLLSGAFWLISILCVISGATIASGNELVDKDTDMQAIFFLDKHSISHTVDMKHRLFQPGRMESVFNLGGNTAVKITYFNVLYDQKKKLYKIWYKSSGGGPLCYAESRDGMKWDVPDLTDVTDLDSSSLPNAVFAGKAGFKHGVVSYDPYDSDVSRRYKLPYEEHKTEMHIAYSPDGIVWRIDPGPTWHPGVRADTENNVFYNPFTERWQIMTRASSVDRRIAMIESEDLKTWNDPVVLIHPSPLDPVGMEFYGMPVFLYEDIFLGLLWKFQTGTTTAKTTSRRNDGIIEPELTYSYNGLVWNRTYRNLIERSQRGTMLGARIYPESLLVDHEGHIRIYSRGFGDEHGSQTDTGEKGVTIHRMRKDGFAGMESFGYEGYLMTKVFVLKGGELTLNVSAPHGSLKVQISDKNGKPYTGFSFDDCVEWNGDDVACRPHWKDKKDLHDLVGKEVRFEIRMQEGILYAIRASLNPGFVVPPVKRY